MCSIWTHGNKMNIIQYNHTLAQQACETRVGYYDLSNAYI